MTIDGVIREWRSKPRRMGCVAATAWFCKRMTGFTPERITRWTEHGEPFQHVVATDGVIRIDLVPSKDAPRQ